MCDQQLRRVLHLCLSRRLLPQRVQHASACILAQQCLTQQVSVVVFFIIFFTHKQEHKRQSQLSLTNSSIGSPTISLLQGCPTLTQERTQLCRLSASLTGWISQACKCLGWQNRGVSAISEASPSSSATKQNNFYPVLNCLVLFLEPNKRYDPSPKISAFKEKS